MTPAAEASPNQTRLQTPRALMLALLLVSLPLGAQSTQPPEQQPPPEQAGGQEEDAVAVTPVPPPESTDEAASTEPEDPFDYEASEQISEDLSVSFPVDI